MAARSSASFAAPFGCSRAAARRVSAGLAGDSRHAAQARTPRFREVGGEGMAGPARSTCSLWSRDAAPSPSVTGGLPSAPRARGLETRPAPSALTKCV